MLDPNAAAFPVPHLVDFATTLDPPAGKRGFLFVGADGRFYFEDGTRGRFWGLNVAKDAVFVPKQVVDEAVAAIAAAGFNLVRLHHIDGVTGLLPPGRAALEARIDPEKLDAVHYWVHALKERGIYAYLDLLDFRTFQEDEGVPEAEQLGRGAKPAAVFNERLIELQIAYAGEFLFGHPNPYTGLPLGADPAVAMVEICDENGLFAKPERWAEMPEVYRSELRRRWNFWLRGTYGATESLYRAWSTPQGIPSLAADERLEDSSVRLLAPKAPEPGFPSPVTAYTRDAARAARDRDVTRFCHSVHREYFAQVKQALRDAGLRAPVTAVTDWAHPADLRAVAEELDFIGCNWYYDHPVFAAGHAWRLPSFFTNTNPIADQEGLDFTSSVLRASVSLKPLVIREWGVCWPSKFRGVGLLEAPAYGALQDIDALILFTYNTDPDARHIEYFDVSSDPVRWGLAGAAGALYRERAVAPARKRAGIGSSGNDSFGPPAAGPDALFRLGWRSQLRHVLFDETCAAEDYDLVIARGRRSGAAYPGRRVLFHVGQGSGPQTAPMLQLSGYSLVPHLAVEGRFVFDGLVYDAGHALALAPGLRFAVDELHAAGYEAIGVDDDGVLACGFFDPQRESCVLSDVGTPTVLRAAIDLLTDASDPAALRQTHAALDRQEHTSDTGELRRLVGEERLVIDAPRVQAVAGALGAEALQMSELAVRSASPLGVVIALSLDGQRLSESERLLVKMVTVAANRGERKSVRDAPPSSPQLKLEAFGAGPVETKGQPSESPTAIDCGGEPMVSAFVVNGTWEAVRTGRRWYLWCDTPGARFSLPGLGAAIEVTPFHGPGAGEAMVSGQPFAYPQDCLFVRVVRAASAGR